MPVCPPKLHFKNSGSGKGLVVARPVVPICLAAAVSTEATADSTITADLKKALLPAVGNESCSEPDLQKSFFISFFR
jgi:hypothetical protein